MESSRAWGQAAAMAAGSGPAWLRGSRSSDTSASKAARCFALGGGELGEEAAQRVTASWRGGATQARWPGGGPSYGCDVGKSGGPAAERGWESRGAVGRRGPASSNSEQLARPGHGEDCPSCIPEAPRAAGSSAATGQVRGLASARVVQAPAHGHAHDFLRADQLNLAKPSRTGLDHHVPGVGAGGGGVLIAAPERGEEVDAALDFGGLEEGASAIGTGEIAVAFALRGRGAEYELWWGRTAGTA